ncbi:hypothetical protein [Actinophytocola oryzae]|nr:hypothetical protein [Actinophytocola oryzae]
MTTQTTTIARNDNLLGVYLNDHLAGATAGVELAKRLAGASDDEVDTPVMSRLAGEIAEDRDALMDVISTLDIPIRQYKVWLGWLAEKGGRLKPNGHVLSRSPLSRVLELEMLRLGIEGKAAVWRTLRARAATDPRLETARFDRLLQRADDQATQVERLRTSAVTEVFGGSGEPVA